MMNTQPAASPERRDTTPAPAPPGNGGNGRPFERRCLGRIARYANLIVIAAAIAVFAAGYFVFGAQIKAKRADGQERATSDSTEVITVEGDRIAVPDEAAKTLGLRTAPATARRVPITLTLTGRTGLDAEQVSHVHAQFPGRVTDLGPPLGATVRGPEAQDGGSPTRLLVVESTDLANAKSDYVKARIQLELDRDALDRTKELVKSNVLADKFLIDAESAVKKDEADFDAARQKLLIFGLKQSDMDAIQSQQGRQRMVYNITSPRSGVITEKNVTLGELADPSLNLFTIADLSRIWIWGDVYERDRRRVKEGQKVKVIVASHPDEARECTIEWISPVLDANTRSIRIRGSLDNRDGRLLADMYCTLVVTLDDRSASILLPADAIVHRGESAFAFARTAGAGGGSGAGTVYQRRAVKVEAVGSGIGFELPQVAETAPAAGSTSVAIVDESIQSASRSIGPGAVRVVGGIEAGDEVVVSGALALFNEMEQQASR